MTSLSKSIIALLLCVGFGVAQAAGDQPEVGTKAPDFSLPDLDGNQVQLSSLNKDAPVVVVMLRGWPGYQCPLCTRQVSGYMAEAEKFAKAGVKVVMVYPGPKADLEGYAEEFVGGKQWPEQFCLVIDPDYEMTNKYGLRWDEPNETAYPSTFVIDRDGVVKFAKVSKGHGGRVSAVKVLKAL